MAAIEYLIDGLQLRHDTAANWRTKNPILAAGEAGVETDTFKLKLGDGSTTWNNVPYANDVDLSAYLKSTDAANTYATKEELNDAVTGGQVDLSGYLTKTEASSTYLGKTAAAASANKLNTNAGSVTQPVYFANGVPVKTTYTLGASVPSGAKFTDTTYSAATTSTAGLMSASDKSKLDGIATGANAYTLPNATSSTLGGVKVGTNISVSSGTISVANGSTSAKGVVQLSSATNSTSTSLAATPSAVKAAYDLANGKLSATDTAAKATADANGNVITDTYETKANAITGLSASGTTVTYTKGDGTTGTITTQDTTYKVMPADEATTGTATTKRIITAKILHNKIAEVVEANACTLDSLGVTATATELNYTSGVTSNIQTQLDGMVDLTSDQSITGKKEFSKLVYSGAGFSTVGNLFFNASGQSQIIGKQIIWTVGSSTSPFAYLSPVYYSGQSASAVKATQDSAGNKIVDTYATLANTYTKTEVDDLLANVNSGGSSGETVDLSAYLTKTEAESTYATIANTYTQSEIDETNTMMLEYVDSYFDEIVTWTEENFLQTSSIVDYIVECSYDEDTGAWYERYASGKVRQGGLVTEIEEYATTTVTLNWSMEGSIYHANVYPISPSTIYQDNLIAIGNQTATSFGFTVNSLMGAGVAPAPYAWIVEGKGF